MTVFANGWKSEGHCKGMQPIYHWDITSTHSPSSHNSHSFHIHCQQRSAPTSVTRKMALQTTLPSPAIFVMLRNHHICYSWLGQFHNWHLIAEIDVLLPWVIITRQKLNDKHCPHHEQFPAKLELYSFSDSTEAPTVFSLTLHLYCKMETLRHFNIWSLLWLFLRSVVQKPIFLVIKLTKSMPVPMK